MNMAFHHCELACDFLDSEPISKNARTGHIYMAFHHCVWACEFLGALYARKNSCTDHKKKVKVFQETEEFV